MSRHDRYPPRLLLEALGDGTSTVHPPTGSWDKWPVSWILMDYHPKSMSDRAREVQFERMTFTGLLRDLGYPKPSFPELAIMIGYAAHNSAHDAYQSWLKLDRATRESHLFNATVRCYNRAQRAQKEERKWNMNQNGQLAYTCPTKKKAHVNQPLHPNL